MKRKHVYALLLSIVIAGVASPATVSAANTQNENNPEQEVTAIVDKADKVTETATVPTVQKDSGEDTSDSSEESDETNATDEEDESDETDDDEEESDSDETDDNEEDEESDSDEDEDEDSDSDETDDDEDESDEDEDEDSDSGESDDDEDSEEDEDEEDDDYPEPQDTDPSAPGYYILDKTGISLGTYDGTFTAGSPEDPDAEINYELYVQGVTSNSGKEIIETLKTKMTNQIILAYAQNPSFTDAEKYNASNVLDSNECWAAAASNVLWNSGWGRQAIDPETGDYFKSEDQLMTYFTSRFVNDGFFPNDAVNWFFDAYYEGVEYENEKTRSLKTPTDPAGPGNADTTDGRLTDYNAKELLKVYSNPFEDIEKFIDNYETSYFGLTIQYVKKSTGAETEDAHALTLVGLVTDNDAETIDERYKAVIIADSNDNSKFYEDTNLSDSDITLKKATCQNQYDIFSISPVEYGGSKVWKIDYDPLEDDEWTYICTIWSLSDYTKELAEKTKETIGTKDLIHDNDFVLEEDQSGIGRKTKNSDGSASLTESQKFDYGEDIYFGLCFDNYSYEDFSTDDPSSVVLEYSFVKDGSEYCSGSMTLPSDACYDTVDFLNINDLLGKYGLSAEPGDYTFNACFRVIDDESNPIKEAYTANNKLLTRTFTINAKPENEPEKEEQKNTPAAEKDSGNRAKETKEQKSNALAASKSNATSTTVTNADQPATGDQSAPFAWAFAALAALMTACGSLVMRKRS